MLALGPEDLPPAFVKEYPDVLMLPWGAGDWLWKLPVIVMALDGMEEGDMLVYLDASCKVNLDGEQWFYEYVEMVQNSSFNMLSFQYDEEYIEFHWTTEHIFRARVK